MAPDSLPIAQVTANAFRLADDVVNERAIWRNIFQIKDNLAINERHDLGARLLAVGAPLEALTLFRGVCRERPTDPGAWSALASALRASGSLDEAWIAVQRALELDPDHPTVLLTAAQIRHAVGDLTGALRWLQRAEAIRLNHRATCFQRGMTKLLAGDYATGWKDFECRDRVSPRPGIRTWNGEPLDGGSLLITAEQGLGDLFQFVRFVQPLRERGAARVVVEAPPSTHRLLEWNGFEVCTPSEGPVTDWQLPLLSLPFQLGFIPPATGAGAAPYLSAPEPRARQEAKTLQPIGFTWMGNPAFRATVLRDFDPGLIQAVGQLPGVQWMSLQYDVPAPPGFVASDLRGGDWLETAVQLRALAGVVTVDTSIAHLAGALGLPTAVLLPFSPDWRWGLETESTHWYGSVRLIRQQAPCDWRSVFPSLQAWVATISGAHRSPC
jgi:Tfp pilus assembly protein PilF